MFIIQSSLGSPEAVWASLPAQAQRFIIDSDIRVFYVDGFAIAREEATDPELQFRMQGNAFQGAFFAGSPLMERVGFTRKGCSRPSRASCATSSARRATRVVADNLRVVRRGFDEAVEITDKTVTASVQAKRKAMQLPVMLKQHPRGGRPSVRHPPLLGADRLLLRHGPWQRQPRGPVTGPVPSSRRRRACSAT